MVNRQLAKLRIAMNTFPKLFMYRWLNRPTPVLVALGITNRCNLKCDYCFVSFERRNKKDLSTKKLLDYINQFIDLGTAQIDIQGGEPTLHPDLGILISYIVERGAQCSIVTNGFMVDEHITDLKKCYVTCVSVDGLPETHDSHRGGGSYDVAVGALGSLANHCVNTRIHGVLTYSTTVSDIDHLVSLADKFRTNVNFSYALDTGIKSTCCDDRAGFPQHVRALAAYVSELKKKGAPITTKEGAIQQVLKWPFGSQEILIEKEMTKEQRRSIQNLEIPRCLWGDMACFFNPDDGGRLYLCPRGFDREDYSVRIGNKTVRETFLELAKVKKCYMCGQMGDLSYSFDLDLDNFRTWLKF